MLLVVSIKMITSVLDLDKRVVDASERLVLVALAWHADEHGRNAWPSVSTLSRRTSLTERGVQKVLNRLRQRSMVYVESTAKRGSLIYAIDLDRLHVDDREPGSDREPNSRSTPVDHEPCSRSTLVDHEPCSPGGEPSSPLPRTTFTGGVNPVHPIRPLTVREPSGRSTSPLRGETFPATTNDDESPTGGRVATKAYLELKAHETFDALGDHAPFDELKSGLVERLNGCTLDDAQRDNLGAFLWSIRQERRARRVGNGGDR